MKVVTVSPLIIIAGEKAITLENQLKIYCEIKTYSSSFFLDLFLLVGDWLFRVGQGSRISSRFPLLVPV